MEGVSLEDAQHVPSEPHLRETDHPQERAGLYLRDVVLSEAHEGHGRQVGENIPEKYSEMLPRGKRENDTQVVAASL